MIFVGRFFNLRERHVVPSCAGLMATGSATCRSIGGWGFILLTISLSAGCQRSPATDAQRPSVDTESTNRSATHSSAAPQSENATLVQLKNERAQSLKEAARLDPDRDGWKSEAFAEAAKHQLEELFATIASPQRANWEAAAGYFVADPELAAIRPALERAFQDGNTQVFRARVDDSPKQSTARANLRQVLQAWWRPLHQAGTAEGHAKVVAVDLEANPPQTTVLFDAVASGQGRTVQQTCTLECRWTSTDTKAPLMVAMASKDFEEVIATTKQPTTGSSGRANRLHQADGKWFTDCTQSALGNDPAYRTQLAYGLNHWMERVERAHSMDDSVRTGLALGDANGDGRDDVYLCQGPGLPNRLFIHQSDGSVRDVAAEAGVDWLDQTASALFVDLDNDGDQDLAIATVGGLLVMENDSIGHFTLRAQLGEEGTDAQSLSAADYDDDRDLDLFLCVYRPARGGRRGDFVFHDATTGGPNCLYRNDIKDSQWQFTNVTQESGLGDGATRYSLAASWEDFDNDGDQDLYVANDYGRNYLYQNNGGHFTDATASTGLLDIGFGMSVSWGDSNRDGKMDLYVGNMFSAAGSRITRQPAFQRNASPQQRAIYQRMARGNSLFMHQPDGTFLDVGAAANVDMGRWAWSSVFTDLNNDGWEDLVVANGYITSEDTGDL